MFLRSIPTVLQLGLWYDNIKFPWQTLPSKVHLLSERGIRCLSTSWTLQQKGVKDQTSSLTCDLLYQLIYRHHSKEFK